MSSSRDDLLVKVLTTRHPIENLLVQFSVLSGVIMVILAVVLSVILTTRLNRDFELLKEHAAATESTAITAPELETDLNYLRWTTYVSIGGGFVILYTGLIWIFWRGWRTINNQQELLLRANSDLRATYQELRDAQEKLLRTERLAAIAEKLVVEERTVENHSNSIYAKLNLTRSPGYHRRVQAVLAFVSQTSAPTNAR